MKKLIGHFGVDSGQVLICDPCYIDSEWKHEEFEDVRRYQHNDGTVLQYKRDFPHFEAIISKYGKSMNQIIADKEAVEMPDDVPSEHPFSYNACCKETLKPKGFGQLYYEAGHAGVGVVSSTGWGDGYYLVYAYIDDRSGRVTRIVIDFMEDEE